MIDLKPTRRDVGWAILRAAAVAGAGPFFVAWLDASPFQASGHSHNPNSFAPPEPDRWTGYQPKFFSAEELQILDAFTDILIPTDETSGAREAHVAPFIDFVVNAAAEYAPEMQLEWREAMGWLRARNFGQLSREQQVSLIEEISEPERDDSKTQEGFFAYRLIKEMTVHAFYTSRAGLVVGLEYKGYAYLTEFPGCNHLEHHSV